MKKMMIMAAMMAMTISANAMSFGKAKNEAMFLSDKMAYELNLTDTQYDAVYEINLDYLMRIDTIYKGVAKSTFDSEGNEVSYMRNPFNRDSAYCSERYYALMQEALQLCNETGDILYDYDYWVCGQDFSDDWSYKVASVYEMTDSTALVDLDIHNFSDIQTTIALRFERDDWYIDDFSPSKDGNDDKKYLRDTISRGLKMRNEVKQDPSDYAE